MSLLKNFTFLHQFSSSVPSFTPLDTYLSSFCRIFSAAEVPIDWEPVDVTPVRYPDGTMGIPKEVIDSVNRNKVGLKSPLMTPVGKGFRSLNLALRKTFNLYANVRPCRSIEGKI